MPFPRKSSVTQSILIKPQHFTRLNLTESVAFKLVSTFGSALFFHILDSPAVFSSQNVERETLPHFILPQTLLYLVSLKTFTQFPDELIIPRQPKLLIPRYGIN